MNSAERFIQTFNIRSKCLGSCYRARIGKEYQFQGQTSINMSVEFYNSDPFSYEGAPLGCSKPFRDLIISCFKDCDIVNFRSNNTGSSWWWKEE